MNTTESLKNLICDAALAAGTEWVRFSVIRAALPMISREDMDEALMELSTEEDVIVCADADQVSLSPADRDAQIPFADRYLGLIRFL